MAHKAFRKCGFTDLFHPKFKTPLTYAHPDNNVSIGNRVPQTLDYIMIAGKKKKATVKKLEVESLKTSEGISFSDHEAISTIIEIDL